MGWFNRVKQYAGKVYNKGLETVGKVRTGALSAVGKVKHTIHDIQNFVDKVRKFAPIATDVVDELTDFIPGISNVKHGINTGLKYADKISGYAESALKTTNGTESFINNPSIGSFKELFADDD